MAKLAALMPFGKVAMFLDEVLPTATKTHASTVRNRTLRVGQLAHTRRPSWREHPTRHTVERRAVRSCRADGDRDRAPARRMAEGDGELSFFTRPQPARTASRLGWGQTQTARVVRGGAFNNNERNVRAANRNDNDPDNRNNNIGFRVVVSRSSFAGSVRRMNVLRIEAKNGGVCSWPRAARGAGPGA
jgi:hypothetical protein